MNQRQTRALIIGALAGACIGGLYGVVLVTYRDMLAAQRAGTAKKDCGCTEEAATVAASPELSDKERQPPVISELVKTRDRARAIRAARPELTWPQAMHEAAASKNGTPDLGAEVDSGT